MFITKLISIASLLERREILPSKLKRTRKKTRLSSFVLIQIGMIDCFFVLSPCGTPNWINNLANGPQYNSALKELCLENPVEDLYSTIFPSTLNNFFESPKNHSHSFRSSEYNTDLDGGANGREYLQSICPSVINAATIWVSSLEG